LSKIVKNCQKLSKIVKTCQNLSKLVQTCLDLSYLLLSFGDPIENVRDAADDCAKVGYFLFLSKIREDILFIVRWR
jgi:hypothetical protein